MTQVPSRLERWQDRAAPRSASTVERSSLAEQALSATEAATVASRSARDRLERWRANRRIKVGAVAALGGFAILGLFGVAVVPALDPGSTAAFGTAAMIAALSAGIALMVQAWPGHLASHDLATAIAGDLATADQARLLSQHAAGLEERPGTTAATLLSQLIAEVEQAAGIACAREARASGNADLRARRHERLVPRRTRTTLVTPDNRHLHARIADVSLSGVAVDGNFPGCAVGSRVRVGSRAARVVRVLPRGLACAFTELLPPEALTDDIVL